MTSNYVPGLRLEFARFYGETGHFKLNFLLKIQILASFSYQAFIFTHFPIILRKKKFRFIGTLTFNLNVHPWALLINEYASFHRRMSSERQSFRIRAFKLFSYLGISLRSFRKEKLFQMTEKKINEHDLNTKIGLCQGTGNEASLKFDR